MNLDEKIQITSWTDHIALRVQVSVWRPSPVLATFPVLPLDAIPNSVPHQIERAKEGLNLHLTTFTASRALESRQDIVVDAHPPIPHFRAISIARITSKAMM